MSESNQHLAPGTSDLMLGSTSPYKVVHHATCRHALSDYVWARRWPTWRSLTDELVATGAWQWHRFCRVCCQDGVDAFNDAMTRLASDIGEALDV